MPDNETMIHELDTGTIDASSSFAFDVEESGEQVTRKASGSALGAFVNDSLEYTSALDTTNKTITGAINELHAINGYSYDAYDDTATYAVGDLCIYNNALYKCTTAITTAEAWNASHWTATSIADEIASKQDELVVGTNLDDELHTSSYKPVTNHAITAGIRARALINVQTHTENITLAQGQNRFSYAFTPTSGYTVIGMFVEWQDSAIAATAYNFSWIQFNGVNAYVDITAPNARTGGKLKYTLLEYKTGA